jgi:hypothetical protein
MSKELNFNNNTAFGRKISRKGRVTLISLDFLFVRGLNYLQGVQHSSPLPDYIEDKKSGGQQTDCLKNICAMIQLSTQDLQNREIKQMLKTVIRG